MSYGDQFARILTKALEREEEEFRGLTAQSKSSRQTVRSVHEYYEYWLSVLLVKEVLRDSDVPRLHWEQNKVDLLFLDERDNPVATFEIKFKDFPLDLGKLKEIANDCEKQCSAGIRNNGVEHYVVLLLCGSRQDVEGWNIGAL